MVAYDPLWLLYGLLDPLWFAQNQIVKEGCLMEKEHLEILLESIDSKFQLVLEGHSSLANQIRDTRQELLERADLTDFKLDLLNKKIDEVDERLGKKIDDVDLKLSKKIDDVDVRLSKKIDTLSADLKAHRADTEAHHGIYMVKEG